MIISKQASTIILLFIAYISISADVSAAFIRIPETDSISGQVKLSSPKRYFRPTIYTNGYTTPESNIDRKNSAEKYAYSHYNSGFIVPLFTDTWLRDDSLTLSNFHILTSGNVLRAFPDYSEIRFPYSLYKISWGVRAIYNTGKKNIWFVNMSPFISQDDQTFGKPEVRFSSLLVFNRTVNRNFSYRVGYYRTYILGGKLIHFPLLGVRFGPLDGTYLSIQFPKYASFNFPMGEKFTGALFVRPSGSIFNFSEFTGKSNVIQFRRYEILYGYMMNYRANRNITLNIGSGFSRNRYISFADNNSSGKDLFPAQLQVKPTLFFTAGITIRFGKSISVNNNINMYDIFDLNSSMDPENSNDFGTLDLPSKNKSLKNIEYKDIQDLINEYDLY